MTGIIGDSGYPEKTPVLSVEETSRLLELAQSGDQEAREKLVKHNLRLVRSIVARFSGRGVEFDDLFQIGSLGLIKAIDRFNLEQGVRFSTYAAPLIMGEVKQYLRDNGPVKISRNLKDTSNKLRFARESLLNQNGREPTISELEAATNLSREEIAVALEASKPVSSLQEVVHDEEGTAITLSEQVGEEVENQWMERLSLDEALTNLEPKLRMVIESRFFGEKTQAEIGSLIGVSQVQISRLEKEALKNLRALLREEA